MENRKTKETIKSGPTVIRQTSWEYEQKIVEFNNSNIETLLATLLPEVYVIWQSIKLFKVNGEVLPPIIQAISNIVYSTKLGEVIIEIRPDPKTGEAVIKRIRSIDTRHLDLQALNK